MHINRSCVMMRSGLPLEGLHEVGGWDGESTGLSFDVGGTSQLGGVSPVSISSGLASNSDDSSMNGAGNTVALLKIEFGEVEIFLFISIIILNIFSGGLVNDLLHLESLDGFVLRGDSSAVQAVYYV